MCGFSAAASTRRRRHVLDQRDRREARSREDRRSPRRAACSCRPRSSRRAHRRRCRAAREPRRRALWSSFTSPARTMPLTSRAPFIRSTLRACSSDSQLVATAAHRFLELLLERAPLLDKRCDALLDAVHRRLEQLRDALQRLLFARAAAAYAPGPVTASIRRTPAATPVSATILKRPISRRVAHVRAAAQLHRKLRASSTTRTTSPYFSPNSAIAPRARASGYAISRTRHRAAAPDLPVHDRLDLGQLLRRSPGRDA